ncbi:MAG: ATP-binding protein [Candidatus Micrarchaeia archaeon]
MMLREDLKKIVSMQRKDLSLFEIGIPREKTEEIDTETRFAIIISGIRRCGKSTLLRQLAKRVDGFYYFNFEDPRVTAFEVSDFEKLEEAFVNEYGHQEYYFFDEVQNISRWELFVRSLLDGGKHVLITGSNASLLSKELGTKLTGRHLTYELFPFSFKEFLRLTNDKPNKESLEKYLIMGGFPEYLKSKKVEVLQELLTDILVRDIAVRYGIKNLKILKQLAIYLITNTGKEFSYNSLKEIFKLGSINSAIAFISYFEDAYLLFTVPRFSYSLKKQLVNPKKCYSIDNGLSVANSASFSEDKGRMLENLVFINLRRKYRDIFYFKEKGECDFIVKEKNKITRAVQVCYEISDENRDREINGLLEAMERFSLKEAVIVTFDQEDHLKINNKTINIIPAWKWLD